MKTLEAWYGAPPDRDEPVVQLFLANNGPQIGEVREHNDGLILELFRMTSSLVIPLEELQEVLRIAQNRLTS